MIDIAVVIHRNYQLLYKQLAHWPKIADPGTYRLLIGDNTPEEYRKPLPPTIEGHPVFVHEISGIDGVTHGSTLDFLLGKATSDIVGVIDSDYFWLRHGILNHVTELINDRNYSCVGTQLWYDDTWQYWARHPQREWLPSLPAMFMKRKLALEQTFIVTYEEVYQVMETGWRVRQRLVDDELKYMTYPGFRYASQNSPTACYYGEPEFPMGVHLLKGSIADGSEAAIADLIAGKITSM